MLLMVAKHPDTTGRFFLLWKVKSVMSSEVEYKDMVLSFSCHNIGLLCLVYALGINDSHSGSRLGLGLVLQAHCCGLSQLEKIEKKTTDVNWRS